MATQPVFPLFFDIDITSAQRSDDHASVLAVATTVQRLLRHCFPEDTDTTPKVLVTGCSEAGADGSWKTGLHVVAPCCWVHVETALWLRAALVPALGAGLPSLDWEQASRPPHSTCDVRNEPLETPFCAFCPSSCA